MRSLPLALVALAALLAPTTAFAAGGASTADGAPAAGPASASPSRSFVITGLVFGDRKLMTSGKLSIEDGRLIASVGCNTIGGTVTLDGDRLTIPGPLAMTAMGCLGAVGDAEAMLIKILEAGPFTISQRAWTAAGAAILVEELPAGPGPGASLAPPDDGVVSSTTQSGPIEPLMSCPPVPDGVNGTSPGDVPPDSGSGGSGGSSGSEGSTSTGSTETGSGGTRSDGAPTGSGTEPAATANDLPLASATAAPASTPVSEPGGTAGGAPAQPGIGTDPFVGKPVASDPCAERLAAIDQGFTGAGNAEPPKAADAAAEHSISASDALAVLPIALGLGGLLVAGYAFLRRGRRTQTPDDDGVSGPG
jgi:heat shock protein HslJ